MATLQLSEPRMSQEMISARTSSGDLQTSASSEEEPAEAKSSWWTAPRALLKLGAWRAPAPKACDERWVGHWKENRIEKDKFESTLKLNGVPYLLRKAAGTLKAEFQLTKTDDPLVLNIREKLPTGWSAWRVLREGETFTENLLGMTVTGTYTFCDANWPDASWVQHNVSRAKGMKDHRNTLLFFFDEEGNELSLRVTTTQDAPQPSSYDKWCGRK